MVCVVAAIFEREGRVLICQRTAAQSHALKWEFPGGKVEPGEAVEAALERELEEELGVTGAQGEEIRRYEYAYRGKAPILLVFFRVTEFGGELQNLIFNEMRWEERGKLAEYDFVEGDRQFIEEFGSSSQVR